MKIIILEGVATSGKTTVIKELEKLLDIKSVKYIFVDEGETLMPILNNTDPKISENHILYILRKTLSSKIDLVIFDRLYLTHLWRTDSTSDIFKESENILLQNDTMICFLQIPEELISERIKLAMSHRDKEWNEYARSKGETFDDVVGYYKDQQKDLLKILKNTSIKNQVFNTKDMDFQNIAQEINLLIS